MNSTSTYIKGTCRKCGATVRVEVNGQSVEKLKDQLLRSQPYECPGQHMELGNMLDDYEWAWTPFTAPEPPTDEEYGRSLIEKHGPDRVYYLGDDAIGKLLGIKNLNTLRDLEHLGFGDFGNAEHHYVRHDSPSHTTRFYIQERR